MKKIKPRELKPSVKRLIVHRAVTQPQVPREFLANELIKEISEAGEIPPTLETAKRYISKARNTQNPIDQVWTLARCSEYAQFFPPDSIPILVDYKNKIEQLVSVDGYQEMFGLSVSDISIRSAIWIIRLEPTIKFLTPKLMIDDGPLPELFSVVTACFYAQAEMASELLGEAHFDSSVLDKFLFSGDFVSLARTAYTKTLSTSKPCPNNGNCDTCDYIKIPSLPGYCTTRRKEKKQ